MIMMLIHVHSCSPLKWQEMEEQNATLAQVRRHRSMEGAGDDQSEELKRVLDGDRLTVTLKISRRYWEDLGRSGKIIK